jgi:hypothetical protein
MIRFIENFISSLDIFNLIKKVSSQIKLQNRNLILLQSSFYLIKISLQSIFMDFKQNYAQQN